MVSSVLLHQLPHFFESLVVGMQDGVDDAFNDGTDDVRDNFLIVVDEIGEVIVQGLADQSAEFRVVDQSAQVELQTTNNF